MHIAMMIKLFTMQYIHKIWNAQPSMESCFYHCRIKSMYIKVGLNWLEHILETNDTSLAAHNLHSRYSGTMLIDMPENNSYHPNFERPTDVCWKWVTSLITGKMIKNQIVNFCQGDENSVSYNMSLQCASA